MYLSIQKQYSVYFPVQGQVLVDTCLAINKISFFKLTLLMAFHCELDI